MVQVRFGGGVEARVEISVMDYFHVAPTRLGHGSVIQPGNWGRLIRLYGAADMASPLAPRELIIEMVRMQKYADKPSRLDSVFIFESMDHAKEHQRTSARFGVIHTVELKNSSAPCHRADYKLLRFPEAQVPFIPYWEAVAERYWEGQAIELPELVTASPLRVLDCPD